MQFSNYFTYTLFRLNKHANRMVDTRVSPETYKRRANDFLLCLSITKTIIFRDHKN